MEQIGHLLFGEHCMDFIWFLHYYKNFREKLNRLFHL